MKEMCHNIFCPKKLSKRLKNFYKKDAQSFSKNIKKQQKLGMKCATTFLAPQRCFRDLRTFINKI